ncbi:hypothetical protein FOZ62_000879, partial [Perkinsus olseni]
RHLPVCPSRGCWMSNGRYSYKGIKELLFSMTGSFGTAWLLMSLVVRRSPGEDSRTK